MGRINFKTHYKNIGNISDISISINDKDLDGLEVRLRDYVNKAFDLKDCDELDQIFDSLRSLDEAELKEIMDLKMDCIFALRFPKFTSNVLIYHIRYYNIYFKLYNQIKKIIDNQTVLLLKELVKKSNGITNITVSENIEYVNQHIDEIVSYVIKKINNSSIDQTCSSNKLFIDELLENIDANIYYAYFNNFRNFSEEYYSNIISYSQGEVTKRLKKINNIQAKNKIKKDNDK